MAHPKFEPVVRVTVGADLLRVLHLRDLWHRMCLEDHNCQLLIVVV
jgi:hypothetical protein